jgi:hypothetical protein
LKVHIKQRTVDWHAEQVTFDIHYHKAGQGRYLPKANPLETKSNMYTTTTLPYARAAMRCKCDLFRMGVTMPGKLYTYYKTVP